MSKKPKPDFTQVAFRVAQQAARLEDHHEASQSVLLVGPKAEAGQKGGIKGGKARAAKLTPEERSEAARKAALARWKPSK
jgi:hypothetical protein